MIKSKTKKQNPLLYVAGILVVIILALVAFSSFINALIPFTPMGMRLVPLAVFRLLETVQFLALIISTINAILLTYLLYTYVSVYQEIRSQFSLGLIALASALLAHTISSNPIVAYIFGFHGSGLGPFEVIPSIFTLAAAIVLIHLSRQ